MASSFDNVVEMNDVEYIKSSGPTRTTIEVVDLDDSDHLHANNKDCTELCNNINNGESSTGSSCNSSRENSPKVGGVSDSIYSGSELGYQTGSTYLEPSSSDSLTSEDSDSNCNLDRSRGKRKNMYKTNAARRLSLANQRNHILQCSAFENNSLHLSNQANKSLTNQFVENENTLLGTAVAIAAAAARDLSPVSKKPRLCESELEQATSVFQVQKRIEDMADRKRRFLKTAEILRRSGLMEITMKTAELLKRNQELQKEIDLLKVETKKFYECVLLNPQNANYNSNLRNGYVRTNSISQN